jgi:hypothetical protein
MRSQSGWAGCGAAATAVAASFIVDLLLHSTALHLGSDAMEK